MFYTISTQYQNKTDIIIVDDIVICLPAKDILDS